MYTTSYSAPWLRRLTCCWTVLLLLMLPVAVEAQEECGAFAGTLSVDFGPHCLVQGEALLTGTPSADAIVPAGYTSIYLLTRTNGLIIEQMGPAPNFMVTTVDVWRIHRLVHDPATLDLGVLQPGSSSAYDLQALITQGGGPACGSLSMTGAAAKTMECEQPCAAFAAGMAMDTSWVCLMDGQVDVNASLIGVSMVPPGFEQRFLLTRTDGQIIEQIAPVPAFTVASEDTWRIVHLVYDPTTLNLGSVVPGTTTAFELESLLLQGGGSICASLNLGTNPTVTAVCTAPCTANAGTLHAELPDLCLMEGVADLAASPNGDAALPAGHALVYLLAVDSDQLIIDLGPVPEFTVYTSGTFVIHTLVYDPATFDPSSIATGSTTLTVVATQFIQGGGSLCGSLDMEGAIIQVVDCNPTCAADAGSMLGVSSPSSCLAQGSATLVATSYGDTLIPSGFSLGFLLTQEPGPVLVELGSTPTFTVTQMGTFRIHAFVYDSSTWADLSITWGTTTVYDLNDQLIQGGGTHCAGLDVLGTTFQVEACAPSCDGGTDTTITVCLNDPPFAMIDQLGGEPCPGGNWSNPANPLVSGTFNPASNAAGMYIYTVTSPDGTTHTAILVINVLECPELGDHPNTGLVHSTTDAHGSLAGLFCPADLEGIGNIRLWPVPVVGIVHAALPFTPTTSTLVELTDATGRQVQPATTSSGKELLMDVSTLPSGLWTVRIMQGNTAYRGRFIK